MRDTVSYNSNNNNNSSMNSNSSMNTCCQPCILLSNKCTVLCILIMYTYTRRPYTVQ